MINGNLIGFGMVVVSALIIALPGYLLRLPDALIMGAVGGLLVVVDLAVRLINRTKKRWLMSQQTGGYLLFIPVWIFGVAVVVINLINAFLIKK